MLSNLIIIIFKYLHIIELLIYLEKYFDKYPIVKKNKNELIEAPKPKLIFSKIMKLLVKLPKMKTVSEYT